MVTMTSAILGHYLLMKTTSNENSLSRTSRDTATPISRPVYMSFCNFNINPVIDVRPR